MRYYVIQEGTLLLSENKNVLIEYYGNAYELPEDYNEIKYKVVDGELVLNPNWEEEVEEQKRKHIASLTCTKRVFALMLKELGVPYSKLKELIATNEDAQLEWDLCVELLRANPMLDIMGQQLELSPTQLDKLFLYANGEITLEEFKENE